MRGVRSVVHEARREEQYGDLPKAIQLYRKALRQQENEDGVGDPDLYNRLGDLHLRVGEPKVALECFEQAIHRLEEQQLYSAAIALCKKILRNAPAHTDALRRAGRLQARVGLQAEARESYIEYANRVERAGDLDSGLEALREFVELSGDEEIRLALADRYLVADRTEEAVDELRRVFRQRLERGEDVAEIRRRIGEVDPDADPHAGREPSANGAEAAPEADDAARGPGDEDGATGDDRDEPDIAALAAEMQAILGGLEGEERLRQAVPVIDQLLRLEPHQIDLLQRKLGYALALDDEAGAIEAYLGLGAALEARLSRFTVRFLSSSSADGATTAVRVEERPAAAPVG